MKKTLTFLKKLKENNTREWFNAHKDEYQVSEEHFKAFFSNLAERLKKHDRIDEQGAKIFRIYRDVRFSKNKLPYKLSRSGYFTRLGEALRGGYYLHIEPQNCFIAGGFWDPSPQDLLHVRKQIEAYPEPLRAIISSPAFKNYFVELQGNKVKTAPKGFSIDSEAIDLLRYKQFLLTYQFSDKEVLERNFIDEANRGFVKMRPLLNYMSEILTTDLNGVSLLS